MKTIINSLGVIILATVIVSGVVYAGSLTAPSAIAPQSYTLSDIYKKLVNISYTPSAHILSTTTSAAPSFYSLGDIYNKLSTDGSLITPGNIRDGVEIFGVRGTYTGSGGPAALTWSMAFTGVTGPYLNHVNALCWDANQNQSTPPTDGICSMSFNTQTQDGGGLYNNHGIPIGAVEYCAFLNETGNALTTTKHDYWRLPTSVELGEELVRLIITNPDPVALRSRFPSAIGGRTGFGYWTSTVTVLSQNEMGVIYSFPAAYVRGSRGYPMPNVPTGWYYDSVTNSKGQKKGTAFTICVK